MNSRILLITAVLPEAEIPLLSAYELLSSACLSAYTVQQSNSSSQLKSWKLIDLVQLTSPITYTSS